MPTVTVNGTKLHHEIRGTGPPVLLIMGATGDGGHFDALADLLADEFTVVTYDRRGNGRSPVPAGWQTTSPEEQADDAAALLDALGVRPAAIFGTSSGGTFALCLLIRHPGAVRGAILHEPGLYGLVDDLDAARAPVRALVRDAMEAGGPAAAVERLWRYVVGDHGWTTLAPALRKQLVESADTLFEIELGTYERYLPDDETLAATTAPVRLLVSEASLPVFTEMARRLGERLGLEVASTPGTHAAYHDHPRELAQVVRPFPARGQHDQHLAIAMRGELGERRCASSPDPTPAQRATSERLLGGVPRTPAQDDDLRERQRSRATAAIAWSRSSPPTPTRRLLRTEAVAQRCRLP